MASQFKLTPPYVDSPVKAFLLCTDGRIGESEWGANDAGIKTYTLGYNFMAMMAGGLYMALDLCRELERDMQAAPAPITKGDAFATILGCAERFCSSVLCVDGAACDLLITGFVGPAFDEPVMLTVSIRDKHASVESKHMQEAVGSGAFLALAMMRHRGYDPVNADLAMASYLSYEAKRFSETDADVGPKTWLKVHLPLVGDCGLDRRNGFAYMSLSPNGLTDLETWREEFFLRPVDQLKGREFRRFV